MNENEGIETTAKGLKEIEMLCNKNSRFLIIQDRFKLPLLRKLARALDVSYKKEELKQKVYESINDNEVQTYLYYRCIYNRSGNMVTHRYMTA